MPQWDENCMPQDPDVPLLNLLMEHKVFVGWIAALTLVAQIACLKSACYCYYDYCCSYCMQYSSRNQPKNACSIIRAFTARSKQN